MSAHLAEPVLDAAPSALASEPPPAPTANPLAGNPGMVGIPTVIAGAIGLGLVNTGYVPPTAAGAAVPIIMGATAIGLLLATIWAAALGHNASSTLWRELHRSHVAHAACVSSACRSHRGRVDDLTLGCRATISW